MISTLSTLIKVSLSVMSEMERLTSNTSLLLKPSIITWPSLDVVKIGHLNIRFYYAKVEDIAADVNVSHAA